MTEDQTTQLRIAMLNLNNLMGNMLFLTEETCNTLSRPGRYNGRAVFSVCFSEYEEIHHLLRQARAKIERVQRLCRPYPEEPIA